MAVPPVRPQILVIDDEDLIRWSLRQGLESLGYSVTDLASAEEAAARAEQADLVLVDWRLPGLDGLTLATQLKRARPSRPVILMTAYGTAELAEAAAEIGIAAVLRKPFDLEEALSLVRSVLPAVTAVGAEPRP